MLAVSMRLVGRWRDKTEWGRAIGAEAVSCARSVGAFSCLFVLFGAGVDGDNILFGTSHYSVYSQ